MALLFACAVTLFLSCVVVLPIITNDALSPTTNNGRELYIASALVDLAVMLPLLVFVCKRMSNNRRNAVARNKATSRHSRSSSLQLSESSATSSRVPSLDTSMDIVFVGGTMTVGSPNSLSGSGQLAHL
jgi:hypothetical protein